MHTNTQRHTRTAPIYPAPHQLKLRATITRSCKAPQPPQPHPQPAQVKGTPWHFPLRVIRISMFR